MASDAGGKAVRRLPLARSRKRLRFERRVRVWLWVLAVPAFLFAIALLQIESVTPGMQFAALAGLALAWLIASNTIVDMIVRPMQTLSNVVAALREDDYSFRARGAQRDDALGDLALEINALANMLQFQRVSAIEAAALLQQVVEAMETPVLAFDPASTLRLLNPAGARVLGLDPVRSLGRSAHALGLTELLAVPDEGVIDLDNSAALPQVRLSRWLVRRTLFRQRGVPQTLLLLSDVSSALREEERQAWQKLIRVLGHEINNSLAPIKSIAGSLRSRLPKSIANGSDLSDFERGLNVIESRAESLHRFVEAYRQLAQLPPPAVRMVSLRDLVERIVKLETRLPVAVLHGPEVDVPIDPDQVEQLLINLLKNAVEAAIELQAEALAQPGAPTSAPAPEVQIGWSVDGPVLRIVIRDNGPGLTNPSNLFVPFYTTKKSGTGVGLILARQIAEAHGGTMSLTNRGDAVGCEALVRLPLIRPLSDSPSL